jgi:ABC transporter substrate binding protein (PQQ-dependent alcohol dehydrogenase system)
MRRWAAMALGAAMATTAALPDAQAQDADMLEIPVVYLARAERPRLPLTFTEPVLEDEGVQGARLGIADNNTTGRFTKQTYILQEVAVPETASAAEAARRILADGKRIVVADLPAADLLAVADLPEAADALIFNARAPDENLRGADCRANVFHTAPDRYMLADALGQYLTIQDWKRWFLVVGPTDGDRAYAEAIRRTAGRYEAEIVEEKPWTFAIGHRRTDSGVASIRGEVRPFTQAVDDYDVLIVADEADQFGEYLPYRTIAARPVAGTQGLYARAWSRVTEQWGGTQLQTRFEKLAGRFMTDRDYTVWLAVRSVGEAVTRTGSADTGTIRAYLRSPDFAVAGFKGQPFTFRLWDNQMRQPILVAGPRILISVAPEEGFLHPVSALDTLGIDQPESTCALGG